MVAIYGQSLYKVNVPFQITQFTISKERTLWMKIDLRLNQGDDRRPHVHRLT